MWSVYSTKSATCILDLVYVVLSLKCKTASSKLPLTFSSCRVVGMSIYGGWGLVSDTLLFINHSAIESFHTREKQRQAFYRCGNMHFSLPSSS